MIELFPLELCDFLDMHFCDLAHFCALQVLMNILSTRGVLGQGACLDALISIMLESSANQMVNIMKALNVI